MPDGSRIRPQSLRCKAIRRRNECAKTRKTQQRTHVSSSLRPRPEFEHADRPLVDATGGEHLVSSSDVSPSLTLRFVYLGRIRD